MVGEFGAIETDVVQPIPHHIKDCTIADSVVNGDWGFDKINPFVNDEAKSLNDEAKSLNRATFPSHANEGEGYLYWKNSPSGKFSLKSTTDYLLKEEDTGTLDTKDKRWTNVWKWNDPLRVKTFL